MRTSVYCRWHPLNGERGVRELDEDDAATRYLHHGRNPAEVLYDRFFDNYEEMSETSPSSAQDAHGFPQDAIWIDVDVDFLGLTNRMELAERVLQMIVPYSEDIDSKMLHNFLATHGFRFRFPLRHSEFVAFYVWGNWQDRDSSEHKTVTATEKKSFGDGCAVCFQA